MQMNRPLVVGTCLYLAALAALHAPAMIAVRQVDLEIAGPDGLPCPATLWMPANDLPRAMLLAGHGVTANQGIMAMIANVFVRDGYAVTAFDFSGHGRSRERFDWNTNTGVVRAWCAWARERYPGLPLAYLGYSMGGFAGTDVFLDDPMVDAFVALGALPRAVPECPTAVAAGAFEQLFTIEQARERLGDPDKVISSPFSDHATAAHDPVLIRRVNGWLNETLGLDPDGTFPWRHWLLTLGALIAGVVGALTLAFQGVSRYRRTATPGIAKASTRAWSVNPYRVAGMALGCRGTGAPPNNGSPLSALAAGVTFAALLTLLLSWLLDTHLFTSSMNHPERLLTWLILTFSLAGPVFVDAWILERLPLNSTRKRFAVAALTRAVPFLALGLFLQWQGPGIAFAGMICCIYAFVLVVLSLVHALATRAAADWRAGALASAITFAWLIAFWFPLYWPWV